MDYPNMNKTENNLIAANLFTLKNELKTMLDNYDFDANALPLEIPTVTDNYQIPITTNLKSLPTASLVRILNTEVDHWKYNYIAYDEKARPVWSKSKNTFLDTRFNKMRQ